MLEEEFGRKPLSSSVRAALAPAVGSSPLRDPPLKQPAMRTALEASAPRQAEIVFFMMDSVVCRHAVRPAVIEYLSRRAALEGGAGRGCRAEEAKAPSSSGSEAGVPERLARPRAECRSEVRAARRGGRRKDESVNDRQLRVDGVAVGVLPHEEGAAARADARRQAGQRQRGPGADRSAERRSAERAP